jgi:hypothetical protein
MRFSEVFAASSVASLVAAHGGIQGAPKLFGLPNDIKIRMPSPRALLAPPLLWRVLTTSRPVREVTPTIAAVPTLAMRSALPATAALEL